MPSAEYMKKHGADPKKSPAFNMEHLKKVVDTDKPAHMVEK